MSVNITYNDNVKGINEVHEITEFLENYEDIIDFLKTSNTLTHKDLINTIDKYISNLAALKNTKTLILNLKYTKDNLLCQVIENTNSPRYLRHSLFNYKALVLYFMRNYKNTQKLFFENFEINKLPNIDLNKLKDIYFLNESFISINTHLDTLLHLINIDKKDAKEKQVLEQMIYDTLDYGKYVTNEHGFKAKVSSVPWIKQTLENPDFIYDEDSIIAKKLNFTLAFIRETGSGSSSEKYMYHLVGLKRIKGNHYTLISQFPIEKDRDFSKDGLKISQLHKYVQCDKPLYIRNNKEIPKFSESLVIDESAIVNKLKNHL